MTHQSGYKLSSLRVTYTSKLRADLETTIKNLRKALAWIPCRHSEDTDPLPQRLQRRAWRVWYNKAPHAIGWSKRHYVFHDWRYAFDFKLMRNHRETISSILGSMSADTSCVVDLNWYNPVQTVSTSTDSKDEKLERIFRGRYRLEQSNRVAEELKSGDPSIQKQAYMDYRQYVGSHS